MKSTAIRPPGAQAPGADLYRQAPAHIRQYLRVLHKQLGESPGDIAAAFHHWLCHRAVYGWVAIGDVFEVDGRTARRWNRQYAMPVRHLPNGKVYALMEELYHWREGWGGVD